MKKILSISMVFMLIFSMLSGMEVSVLAQGISGSVVIARYDFENGPDGFLSAHGGKAEFVDNGTDKCISLTYGYTPAEIIKLSGTGAFGNDYAMMGFSKGVSIPMETGRDYFFRFNAKWGNDSEGKFNQMITIRGNQYWPSIRNKGTSSKSGWTVFESGVFNRTHSTSSTLTGFYLKSNIYKELADAMVATKSYHGTGLGTMAVTGRLMLTERITPLHKIARYSEMKTKKRQHFRLTLTSIK